MRNLQAAREYEEDVGSPAYRQILRVLNQVNEHKAQEGQPRVTFRQAVQAMDLRDPFTGKIKSGVYVPTMERLEQLAEFLGVEPTVFDIYVIRFAVKLVTDGGMIETFRRIARLNPRQQRIIQNAVDTYSKTVCEKYLEEQPKRELVAVAS